MAGTPTTVIKCAHKDGRADVHVFDMGPQERRDAQGQPFLARTVRLVDPSSFAPNGIVGEAVVDEALVQMVDADKRPAFLAAEALAVLEGAGYVPLS